MENSRAINKNNLNIDIQADGQIKIIVNNETTLNVDAAKNLYDILKPIFEKQQNQEPTLLEEPEEAGLYATQNGILLTKDDDGDWSYRKYPYEVNVTWSTEYKSMWEDDWEVVVATIGEDAFPLRSITERDVIALAQSNK